MKFKAGDRVIVGKTRSDADYMKYLVGRVGTIVDTPDSNTLPGLYEIKLDIREKYPDNPYRRDFFFEDELLLYDENVKVETIKVLFGE